MTDDAGKVGGCDKGTLMNPLHFLALPLALSLAPIAAAQADSEPEDAILILDASGSMWGQIDGVNKIVIAKDVVEGLVLGMNDKQRLGMVAYGHRREGDCSDIETIADVGASRDVVIDALRKLTPHGKTPLSKSVEHAANALNYKQNAASVILVSDGLETCEVDPCALARTLEENGLDFTVHVVGFDVTQQERAGLQCIADETGGTFVAADNADELAGALQQVAVTDHKVEESSGTPVPSTVSLKATILQGGPEIQSELDWTITPAAGGDPVFTAADTGYETTELLPGDYVATARWHGWRQGAEVKTGSASFTIVPQSVKVLTIPIDLDFSVSLDVPSEVSEGTTIPVTWTGPDDLGAYIQVASVEDSPFKPIYFFPAQRERDRAGVTDPDAPVSSSLGAPSNEGEYEVRYVLADPRIIVARQSIGVTDGDFLITAPSEAAVASEITVQWSGQNTDGDFVAVVPSCETQQFPANNRGKLKDDGTADVTLPAEPGQYEVCYVLSNGYTTYEKTMLAVQASAPITLTAVEASVSGPSQIVGGETVQLTVDLPSDWEDDYVSFITPGATKSNRDSVAYLGRANAGDGTLELQAPNIDGAYELAYFLRPGDKVLSRQPVTISRAEASVDAPAIVQTGTNFSVSFTGPGYSGDRIIVTPVDVPDLKMWGWGVRYGFGVGGETSGTGEVRNYDFKQPGEYLARYVTGKQHQVLARDTFIVTE